MISQQTYQFLNELKEYNNREWFTANKSRYDNARAEFTAFIGDLILRIAEFDPPILELEPKKCIFRIYRDTRFSKDKTPYKTNLGAHLLAHGEKLHGRAGYYIHIEPGNTFLAGGAYLPEASWLKTIRQSIEHRGDVLINILNNPDFKKYFGEIQGEKLKTTPRDYSQDHPHIGLLRHKSFFASHKVNDNDAISGHFIDHAATVFQALKPFDDFLNGVVN